MKQGLSLRISQHLALTPQLQQSIRLLQLSTLELSSEVDQMLDDNPFLERNIDEAERESFGLAQADVPVSQADRESEVTTYSGADYPDSTSPLTMAPAGKGTAPSAWPPMTANGAVRRQPVATTSAVTTRWTPPSWHATRSHCRAFYIVRRWRCA